MFHITYIKAKTREVSRTAAPDKFDVLAEIKRLVNAGHEITEVLLDDASAKDICNLYSMAMVPLQHDGWSSIRGMTLQWFIRTLLQKKHDSYLVQIELDKVEERPAFDGVCKWCDIDQEITHLSNSTHLCAACLHRAHWLQNCFALPGHARDLEDKGQMQDDGFGEFMKAFVIDPEEEEFIRLVIRAYHGNTKAQEKLLEMSDQRYDQHMRELLPGEDYAIKGGALDARLSRIPNLLQAKAVGTEAHTCHYCNKTKTGAWCLLDKNYICGNCVTRAWSLKDGI